MVVKNYPSNKSHIQWELTFVLFLDCFPSVPLCNQSLVVGLESFFWFVRVKAQPDFMYVLWIIASKVNFLSLIHFQKPPFNLALHGVGGCHLKKVIGYERCWSSLHQNDCGLHLVCDSCNQVFFLQKAVVLKTFFLNMAYFLNIAYLAAYWWPI